MFSLSGIPRTTIALKHTNGCFKVYYQYIPSAIPYLQNKNTQILFFLFFLFLLIVIKKYQSKNRLNNQ